jgi:hypothetical protein
MSDFTRYRETKINREMMWAPGGEMDEALSRVGATPCLNKGRLFDAAHKSFVARWAARTLCDRCPLSGEFGSCLKAGTEGGEVGVWGGFSSSDGKTWSPVGLVRQGDVLRALLKAVSGKRGVAMIRAVDRIAPGMRELFLDDDGKMKFKTVRGTQCIVRDGRQSLLPNGERGSARSFIMMDLLGVVVDDGQLVVHATCSTGGCIAPWHLRWIKAPHGMPRSIALALHSYYNKGWKLPQASEISGILPRELRLYCELSELFSTGEQLPGPELETMTTVFKSKTNRAPTNRELTALIRLCGAADDLDCDSIEDLLVVGESEF